MFLLLAGLFDAAACSVPPKQVSRLLQPFLETILTQIFAHKSRKFHINREAPLPNGIPTTCSYILVPFLDRNGLQLLWWLKVKA